MPLLSTYYYKLLDDPFVCTISAGYRFEAAVNYALNESGGRFCHILVRPAWNMDGILVDTIRYARFVRNRRPKVQLTFLCPTLQAMRAVRLNGFEALHINQNAFLDEKIHFPDPAIKKQYSAVHVANLSAFKRHELAWGVRNIAIVTYSAGGPKDQLTAVHGGNLSGYKQIGYSNFDASKGVTFLSAEQVHDVIAAANCGLILSAEEGSNYATVEYFLNGIPLVTTPSKGGRDDFYNTRFVKIVEPNAASVEAAVDEWNRCPPDPQAVREAALVKMREHRRRLLAWLNAISDTDHFADADANLWSPLFINKLRNLVEVDTNAFTLRMDKRTSLGRLRDKIWSRRR